MDSFLEYLMIKKNSKSDIFLKVGIVILAVILSLLIFVLFVSVAFLRTYAFLAVLFVGYGAYVLLSRMSIEFEYIFTNGDLDIDIIRGRKSRKRLTSLKCKNIKNMEKVASTTLKPKTGCKMINAVYNPELGEIYKIEATDKHERDVYILFQPTENLVSEMKKFNPFNIKA